MCWVLSGVAFWKFGGLIGKTQLWVLPVGIALGSVAILLLCLPFYPILQHRSDTVQKAREKEHAPIRARLLAGEAVSLQDAAKGLGKESYYSAETYFIPPTIETVEKVSGRIEVRFIPESK